MTAVLLSLLLTLRVTLRGVAQLYAALRLEVLALAPPVASTVAAAVICRS